MKHKEGLLAIHASVFILGLTALFSKLIELPALEITFLRSLFAMLVLWGLITYKGESIWLRSKRDVVMVFMLGLLLAVHWVTYFHSMQVSTIAVGVISLYTYPVITVFLEPIFHGERPHVADIISGLTVLFGIYLMVPEFDWNNQTVLGIAWGVFSALLFALRNIMQGRYFSHYSARQSQFYQSIVVLLVLLPFAGSVIADVTSFQWFQLLILGVFFTALPHTLYVHGLRYLKAKTAALIACLQVVYATTFAAVILSEWPETMTLLGGAIVVMAAVYESYFAKHKMQLKT